MKKLIVVCAVAAVFAAGVCRAETLKLFDEEDGFVDLISQHAVDSVVEIEAKDVFAGKKALKVTPQQSYIETIDGWEYHITDKPGKGEFRYIMFAWKKMGGEGIMIQFPDSGQWGGVTEAIVEPGEPCRRYVAGENVAGWSSIQIDKNIPAKWTPVIRDMYADFGEFIMTGIAFTPFDGDVGLWDCIYLGTTKDELVKLADKIKNK